MECGGGQEGGGGVPHLHALRLVPQPLLVDRELLRNLGPGLARQNVLELNVQLVLLLDEQILLHNLFGLCNEAFL